MSEMGRKELDVLRGMFRVWLESDFRWALEIVIAGEATGENDEWDFLWEEWVEKFENWMVPYVLRLRDTEHTTTKDLNGFGTEMYNNMKLMLSAIYALSEEAKNEQAI